MRILVCVDDDPVLGAVLAALDWTVEMTKCREILALHVVPHHPLLPLSGEAIAPRSAEALLERFSERLPAAPAGVRRMVSSGEPAQEISRVADACDADLIILGAVGERRDLLAGSVSRKVVSTATTDVLVVRGSEVGGGAKERKRSFGALVAVDGSPGSEAGIDAFVRKLRARSAAIQLVHVLETPPPLWEAGRERGFLRADEAGAAPVLSRARKSLQSRGLDAECLLRRGAPAAQILQAARSFDSDVIVLGSRGRSALREMVLGGITHRVLRHAPCTVLCARGWAPERTTLSRRWSSEALEPGAGMA